MLCSVFVTAGTQDHAELLAEIVEALDDLGLDARTEGEVVTVDGTRVVPLLVARAHPTPADLGALVAEARGRGPCVIVADRISDAGRDVLRADGWGWLDRRGHLRIWAPGVRVESRLPSAGAARPSGGNVWTTVGLEIALHALIHPDEPVTARNLATVLDRSVGSTHELITRFGAVGLIGKRTRRPLVPELFWETAANWPDDDWTPVPLGIEEVVDRLDTPAGLIRVDERAATLGGARIAAAGDLPARCYVPSASAMRLLRSLADHDAPARCWVRTPPVRWIPLNDDHPPDTAHPWSVAHPMLCAIRLAADPARGGEIVEAWGVVPDDAQTDEHRAG